jgi:hypothetical protein
MFYLLAVLIYIYCSRHRITDCDPFTDDFLTAQGIKVNPKEPEPKDQFGEHRSKVNIFRNRIFQDFTYSLYHAPLSTYLPIYWIFKNRWKL